MIVNHCAKQNDRAFFNGSPKSPFIKCVPICSSAFRRSQWHSIEPTHHFSSKPGCNNTAYVPSFILRTALSPMPFLSGGWGVHVQLFHDKSSQDLPNSNEFVSINDCHLFQQLKKTFVNSFPSHEKFLVYTDKIVSIQWLNPVPRQQICDCFEIPLLHSENCDLLLSSHRVFLPEVLLRQCVSCKEPS